MKRPVLSEGSFLAHLFHPKKVDAPTGLRKTKLKGTRGTVKRRVTAYNKLTAVQQETLKRSGTRDSYLKGESSLADAKRALRQKAVQLGLAQPVRPRRTAAGSRRALDAFVRNIIAQNLINKTRDEGLYPNVHTVIDEMEYLDEDMHEEDMKRWDYGHIKYAGRKHSEYETWVDGTKHNPFWYH